MDTYWESKIEKWNLDLFILERENNELFYCACFSNYNEALLSFIDTLVLLLLAAVWSN